ncbi:hypothetical protein Pve01_44150 [Planomonospora venezuelensis]|nr:hypothetical protein Pve01_44150 [Planomonospora venezuelensis]
MWGFESLSRHFHAGMAQQVEAAAHAQTLAPGSAFAAVRRIDRGQAEIVGCGFESRWALHVRP